MRQEDPDSEASAPPQEANLGAGSGKLELEALASVFERRLTAAMGTVHAEAASVCLADRRHPVKVSLLVEGHDADATLREVVLTRLEVSEPMQHSHKDQKRTTDWGAAGVALLLTRMLTGLELVTQSDTGTGIDYYFGRLEAPVDPENPFKGLTRLEVSGIRHESATNKPKYRVTQKLDRLKKHVSTMPAVVAVVEFGRPVVRLAERPLSKYLVGGAPTG